MSQTDYKTVLCFSDQWFSLGVQTEEGLRQFGATYEASQDRNSEHYRYGAFRRYLSENRPLPVVMADALYELGASDPDGGMGEAMMADILELPECPASLSAKALASGRKALVKIVERRQLLSEVCGPDIAPEAFSRCLEGRDSAVQRALLAQVSLSAEQLQVLAQQGASRAIRSRAADKLRRCRKESGMSACFEGAEVKL